MFVHIAQLPIIDQIRVRRNRSAAGIVVTGNFAEAVLQNEVTLRCKDTPTHKLSKLGQRTRSKCGEPKANPILNHCWMWQKPQSLENSPQDPA